MVQKYRLRLWLILFCLHFFLSVTIARATVTVLDYWRMGENDPGAFAGGTPSVAVDSVGAFNLRYGGGAAGYSANVAASASQHTDSNLSVDLTNSAYASGNVVCTNVDNFGVEAWVKPATATSGQMILYNGNSETSGWGIMVNGLAYSGTYGGQVAFGTGTVVPGVWTHVALVRDSGVATLYVNGVAAGSWSGTPTIPLGSFTLGAPSANPVNQFYTGLMDEVRVFTFAPGQFSTNDLLVSQNPALTWSSPNLLEGSAAGTDSVTLKAASSGIPWNFENIQGSFFQLIVTNGINQTNYLVKFKFTANNGIGLRTFTFNLAGNKFTVKQLGTNYVAAGVITLASSGNLRPVSLAVDGAGNIYIANNGTHTIDEWLAGSQTYTTLIPSASLSSPFGVAVDSADNVYIANEGNNTIEEWNSTNQTLATLVSSGLSDPQGVAVDGARNVYIADTGDNAIQEWNVTNNTMRSLVSSGLNQPSGVVVDNSGNVYFSDSINNALKEWNATSQTVTTLASSGVVLPQGVAVDDGDNVYLASEGNQTIEEWNVAGQTLATLDSSGLKPYGVAVDGARNVYIGDSGNGALKELPHAFINNTPIVEPAQAGSDSPPSPMSVALPNLTGVFSPTSDQPWLTIIPQAKGISYDFTANTTLNNRVAHINVLGQSITVTQLATPILAASNLVEGPSDGTDSVLLAVPDSTTWTASSAASWLHLPNTSVTTSGAFVFTYDANPGSTRTGTLTIAGQTLTVTQAAANYVAAGTIGIRFPGLSAANSTALAVDSADNVYIANNGGIYEWIEASQMATNLVNPLFSGLANPKGLAVDGAGNVYIADAGNNAIDEWNATNQILTNLVSSGLNEPEGVAVDGSGNVYIADTRNQAVKEWNATNQTVTTLVSSALITPVGIAVDSLGNIYIASLHSKTNPGANGIEELNVTNQTVTTLAVSPAQLRDFVAVDNGGNLYFLSGGGYIWEWSASETETNLLGTFTADYIPSGMAVDSARNFYMVTASDSSPECLPHAFVSAATQYENSSAGSDSLPPVVPATLNFSGLYYHATSDQDWLTITDVTNGVVSYEFTANTTTFNRTANISLLGQEISVVQAGMPSLGTTNLVEGPAGGADSILLAVNATNETWTLSANASWLHPINASGTGSTNVGFTFDPNTGSTRTGTLTLVGTTVTVTQAGSNYVAAGTLTLASAPFIMGVAVDSANNVYFTDTNDFLVEKWSPNNQVVSTLISSGLNHPSGVAVDGVGNLYIANSGGNAIDEWNVTAQTLTPLINSNLNHPEGVAVDSAGNVYIADTGNNAVEEWNVTNQVLTTLVSGLYSPEGVTVDLAGNVYISNTYKDTVREWNPATQALTTLGAVGPHHPVEIALDGGGNVYAANVGSIVIKEWEVASEITTNLSSGLVDPSGVALDSAGNIYIGDSGNSALKELPRAFIDTVAPFEPGQAASDSLMPVVPASVNLTGVFYPTSDQSWLTITGATNGVVSYAFTANNTGINRVAHVTVLGIPVTVNQSDVSTPPPVLTGITLLNNGLSMTSGFQFTFTNLSNASFTVLASTNLTLPLANWSIAGTATNLGGGVFQFAAPMATNSPQTFYRVRSP